MEVPRPNVGACQSALDADPVLKTLGLEADDPEEIFEIHSREGAGAFGRVFRGSYKKEPTKLAAIKVIPVALHAGQRGEDIENVRKEIQFLRECDHPNVVGFYGAYYKDGALWVVMEYCGGGSVSDIGRFRHFEEQEIAVILREALHGLMYLHSKKKIHRDIKGGNILLTTTGQVKIADFGVSAQLRDTMSRRGTFVGTPYWMSPEMIQDSDYDYKSDIWSLGITAIELADQKPPLFDEHPMRVLIQIPRNPPPQLKTPSDWSPAFSSFLQYCLTKDPKERPNASDCLIHPFITGVHHIKHVFAQGGGAVVQQTTSTGVTSSPPQEAVVLDNRVAATSESAGKDTTASSNSSEPQQLSNVEEEIEEEIIVVLEEEKEQKEEEREEDEATPCSLDPEDTNPQDDEQDQHHADSLLKAPVVSSGIENRPTIMNQLLDLSVDESFEFPSQNNCVIHMQPQKEVMENALAQGESTTSRLSAINHHAIAWGRDQQDQWSNPLIDIETSHKQSDANEQGALPAHGSRTNSNNDLAVASGVGAGGKFIGGPYGVSHEVCVKFNSIDAKYEGAPECAEWASIHKQFGIPIQQMRCRSLENDHVPALLHMLRRELLIRDGVHCKYVYRINPEQREILAAKQAINTGVFESNKVADPHVFASLIKHWFRDLPVPLLANVGLKEFGIMNQLVQEQKEDATLQLVSSLDELNRKAIRFVGLIGSQERSVMEWLLDHLLEVSHKSKCNMMTSQALSIVMAPNLYRVATSSAEQATSISTRIALTLRVLLLWRDQLGREPLSPIKRSEIVGRSATDKESTSSHGGSKSSSRDLRDRANADGSSLSAASSPLASSSSSSLSLSKSSSQKSNSSRRRLMLLSSLDALTSKSDSHRNKTVDEKLSKGSGAIGLSNQEAERTSASSATFSPDGEQQPGNCSLHAMIQQCVDKLHETIRQEKLTLQELQADKGLKQKLYAQFQTHVWSLVRRFARSKDERKWVEDATKAILHDATIDTTCTGLFRKLPSTLLSMKAWLVAATRIQEFENLLTEQQTLCDKMDQLEQKYAFLTRSALNFSAVEEREPVSLLGEIVGCESFVDLLRWNDTALTQSGSTSVSSASSAMIHQLDLNGNQQTQERETLGANRLLRASLAVVDERRVNSMVRTAKRECALGNLLGALSLNDDELPPHLKQQRDQMLSLAAASHKTFSDLDSV